jgi:hypothetical protein
MRESYVRRDRTGGAPRPPPGGVAAVPSAARAA